MEGSAPADAVSLHYNTSTGGVDVYPGTRQPADLHYTLDQRWVYSEVLPSATIGLLDLYLGVLGSHACPSVVVGHLGQSIDARIATPSGDAFFVTGEENRAHLHRMRALCHAVIVGAETVVIDNPQLTTRAVTGPDPVRVVLDPSARISSDNNLLANHKTATWLVHSASADLSAFADPPNVQRIIMPASDSRLALPAVLSELQKRGVYRVFVEGGGVTVSGMLNAGCLDRMQVAIAPVLVGEGRAALQLPPAISMQNALRPPVKVFRMGEDILWDFNLRDPVKSDVTSQSKVDEATVASVQTGIERLM